VTAYIETRKVAHVMTWANDASGFAGWRAECFNSYDSRRQVEVDPRDYRGLHELWPLRHAADVPPVKPWCSLCTRIIQRRVDEWVAAGVLTPQPAEAADA